MTPFQKLLADKEALAEYVELCRKLPPPDSLFEGNYVWHDGGVLTICSMPPEEYIHLPSDVAEWMSMKGWTHQWTIQQYRGEWGIYWVGTDRRIEGHEKHPHLACARAVLGAKE